MYARKPILPNQASLGPVVQQTEFGDDALNDLQVRKRYIEKNIHENVQVAQGRQKRNYDKRNSVDNIIFEDGEKVLLKYFGRKAGMGTVQHIRYNGPYSIQTYCGKGNYL